MSYVWINPVVASMYDAYVLDEFLRRFGHERVEVKKDWGTIVKEKYQKVVSEGKKPVADMRCPKIQEVLEEMEVLKLVNASGIYPILIHCGIEISEREELKGAEKIITTPCQSLADMGNSLGLEKTWFVPWNLFVESMSGDFINQGVHMTQDAIIKSSNESLPESSPIPPGFFDNLNINTESVTGEEEVREYFTKKIPSDVQLIELLYCKDGCHNGDGIRRIDS